MTSATGPRETPRAPVSRSDPLPPGPWAIALAGAVALAVAMGIGRFAFTPLLPMMLAEASVDLPGASWLASANYLGYLAGALLCTFQPWLLARLPGRPVLPSTLLVRCGLVATGVLTLAMALPWPAAWPALRFAAGVGSAIVFVHASGWCAAQLAQRGASAIGGGIFTGPGAGIAISGLLVSAMVALHWRASTGWLVFGALAFVLCATVWRLFRDPPVPTTAPTAASASTAAPRHGRAEVAWLTAAYGLAGFGYIITATFLPVIARASLPGSPWLDLFWPLFGLGVMVGALLVTRLRGNPDMRWLLAGAYVVQAVGVFISVWWPTLAGFALGSLLLGLPFTALTFFALHEVRRLRPASAPSTMALLTVLYGIGQIVGPPLAAWLLAHANSTREGFALALQLAGSALLLGAAMYVWMARRYPRTPR